MSRVLGPAFRARSGVLLPLALPLLSAIFLASCAGSESSGQERRYGRPSQPFAQDATSPRARDYKLGAPYSVSGMVFVPRHEPAYDRVGVASWYGGNFNGRRTSNGEIYDMWRLTAAHPTLPLPSYVYVTNLDNSRTILVRVNDRGPFVGGRLIDLSRYSARVLGMEGRGLGRVRVRFAGLAPLDGNDRAERQFLAAQPWNRPPAFNGVYAGWPGRMGLGLGRSLPSN